MSLPIYCRPSDIVTADATWSVTAGANAAAYPLANLSDLASHTVAKSTGTTITYRATFGSAQSLDGVAFINTNATAITLSNGAGLSESIAIPATPLDGLPLDPWTDLRQVANHSSTTWDIALTGPSGVALGLPLLVETMRSIPLLWNGLGEDEQHQTIVHQTDYGVRLKLGLGVRQRVVRARLVQESFRTDLLALARDARGPKSSFLLVLDSTLNDARYVDLTSDLLSTSRLNHHATEAVLEFTEQQKGWLD